MTKTKEEILDTVLNSLGLGLSEGALRRRLLAAIQEYSDQEKHVWVKCSDRLPEIGQVVDIWKHDKELSKFYRVTNFTFEKNIVINFTHWMPLPQKPEV